MTPEQKQKIVQAQLAALIKKISGGKPLSPSEFKFVQEYSVQSNSPPVVQSKYDGTVAVNVNDLAKRLGVHRQLIAYHRGRPGSPETFSVDEWRNYLLTFGKIQTKAKLEANDSHVSPPLECDTAFALLFDCLSDALPRAIGIALSTVEIKLSPAKRDQLVFWTWQLLAAQYTLFAERNGAMGLSDMGQDDCEYPDAIRELAARILKRQEPTAETP